MSARGELHKLIDELDDIDAEEVLAHLRQLLSDSDELSEEACEQIRRGEEQIARGEVLTLDALLCRIPE